MFDVQVVATDVIDSLIVNHEGTFRVLQSCVSSQDGVVGLHNCSGNSRSWVNCKFQLGCLSIINRKPLHEKRGKSRSSSATKRVEDQESLESSTLVSKLPDPVQNQVHDLLANCVVSSCVVISSVFFSGYKLLRVEQLAVGSSSDLVDDCWFKIYKDSPGDMLASSSLREEGVEGVVSSSDSLV